MVSNVITTDQTATVLVTLNNALYLAQDVSINVTAGNAVRSNAADANTNVTIDGSVIGFAAGFTAIFLAGKDAAGVGSHEVLVGATGLVRSLSGSGIILSGTGNTVINQGTISGLALGVGIGSSQGYLYNTGTISAKTGISGTGFSSHVVNAGEIEARTTGVSLTGSTHALDNSGLLTSDGNGVQFDQATGTRIRNSGRIDAGETGIEVNANIAGGNVIANSGDISAIGAGVVMSESSATLRNTGTITAGGFGVQMTGTSGLKVINTGSIDSNDIAVKFDNTGALFNHGKISADDTGVRIGALGGTVITSGEITARLFGVNSDGAGRLLNSGTIIAGTGLRIVGEEAQVLNQGRIVGVSLGIDAAGDFTFLNNSGAISGIRGINALGDGVTVMNSGTVVGDGAAAVSVTGARGAIINSATLSGATTGLEVIGEDTTVLNTGSLIGRDVGLRLSGGFGASPLADKLVSVTLEKTSQVSGITSGIAVDGANLLLVNHGEVHSAASAAIQVLGGAATIRNFGLISAGVSALPADPTEVAIELDLFEDKLTNRGTVAGHVDLGSGADILRNFGLIDGLIFLGDGADLADLRFGQTSERISGDAGNDTILGGAQGETIDGGADTDRINAGAGGDIVIGGLGQDSLSGGADADVFLLRSAAESGLGALADRITDFTGGTDDLDLRGFMAGGSFIGAANFGGIAKQVRYTAATGVLQGDVDGNGVADWEVVLTNKAAVTAADFLF